MSRLIVLALAAAALLAGCGEDDAASPTPSGAQAEPGAFPVTIEHKFGSTTLREAPERVVVAGLREQDSLLALGVVPVGTTEWYGKHPGAIFPWAEAALGDAPLPEVLPFEDGIQYEKIAALRPDLILAVYSGLTGKDYDTLSKIAPTVAQPPGQVDWGSSWQDGILTVGRADGKPREAERLRDEAEAALAAPRRRTRSSAVRRPPSPRRSRASTSTARRTPARACLPISASRSRQSSRTSAAPSSAASSRRRSSTCSRSARWCGSPIPGRRRRSARAGSTAGSTSAPKAATSSCPKRHPVRGDVVRQRPQHPAARRRAGSQARRSRRRRPGDADRIGGQITRRG